MVKLEFSVVQVGQVVFKPNGEHRVLAFESTPMRNQYHGTIIYNNI